MEQPKESHGESGLRVKGSQAGADWRSDLGIGSLMMLPRQVTE